MMQKPGRAATEAAAAVVRPRTRAGANIAGASEHNRRVVMQGLRLNGAMSRAQIARGTGLVPQTVSNIMDDLEAEGLIVAAEPVRAGRGQPATPYSIARHGAFAFGMQIDVHRVRAVAVDLLGEIVAGTESALGPGGLEANLGTIIAAFQHVVAKSTQLVGTPIPRHIGLGLAMPAPTGVHAHSDDPWMVSLGNHHPIITALEQATGLPVSLHHDASAAAVAERLVGCARGLDDFVLLFVGYGLGAGLYVGGELQRGTNRLAGEIGLILVATAEGSFPLEDLTALSRLYQRLGLDPSEPDLLERLDHAARTDAPEVREWIRESARYLAWAVDLVECLFDPEGVVVAGQMPAAMMDALHAAILAEQDSAGTRRIAARPRPMRGSIGPFSVAVGAAADHIARAFDPSLSAMTKATA